MRDRFAPEPGRLEPIPGRDWPGGQRPGARSTPGPGERGPIHGDFHRANLLMRHGRVVAVVDWEESCVDLQGYELANAVWQFCMSRSGSDFDRRLASARLEAYGSELAPNDLVPLIVVRLRRELELFRAEEDEPYRRQLRRAVARLDG